MKKTRDYKKVIVAGAFASMVLTGGSVYADTTTPETNQTVLEKVNRRSKRIENLKHHRNEVKQHIEEKKAKIKSHHELRSNVRDALEKGDYTTFKTLLKDHPKAQKVTEEQFLILSKAYISMKEGNKKEAKELIKTLKLQKSVKGTVLGFAGFDNFTQKETLK